MDYCCKEEKKDNEDKDMDVCMVPIGQYIIHRTRHPTRYDIITNGRYTITRVPSTMYTAICVSSLPTCVHIAPICRLVSFPWFSMFYTNACKMMIRWNRTTDHYKQLPTAIIIKHTVQITVQLSIFYIYKRIRYWIVVILVSGVVRQTTTMLQVDTLFKRSCTIT